MAPALAGQEITVTLPDKSRRRVHTNALGRYQLFDVPAGLLQLKVASQQRSVEVTSEDSAATADVELAPR